MNLLGILRGYSRRDYLDEDDPAYLFGTNVGERLQNTKSQTRVTKDTALGLIAVYGSVDLIASTIASMPIHVYKRSREGRGQQRVTPQPGWLDHVDGRPNPETDLFTFQHRRLSSLLLDGNEFTYIADYDSLGRPSQFYNLHPRDVTVRRDASRALIVEWTNRTTGERHTWDIYTPENPFGRVVFVKAFDNGEDRGLSPIDLHKESIGLGLAALNYGAKFYGDGGVPPGLLSVQGQPSQASLDEVAKWWRRERRSSGSHSMPGVMANATWVPISISPEAAQFLQARGYTATEIATGIYRVPPHLIGQIDKTTSWGSGVAEQNRMWHIVGLVPWIIRTEYAWNPLFPRGWFVKLDPEGLLRGDLAARSAYYASGRQWGYLSANDIRDLEDMPPVEGGDIYLNPGNMTNAASGGPSEGAPTP